MADGQAVTAARGIHKATLAVMAEVGVIGKDRTNPNQNYKFRGVDDVVERVGPLMVKHGITCAPRVLSYTAGFVTSSNGKPMSHVHVMVEHTYRAADGSSEVVTTLGEAMDTGDKACPKAMSIALKYSHTEFFEIATFEKDRDTEEHSPEMAPRTQSGARPTTVPAAKPQSAPKAAPRPAQAAPGASTAVFGFGGSKGKPVKGATVKDLEYYRAACLRSLGDPAKANFHAKEKNLLAAIDDELSRHGRPSLGGPTNDSRPDSPTDDGPPPPGDADAPF